MIALEWSVSHAVFVTEMDDEHVEIFQSASALQTAHAADPSPSGLRPHIRTLAAQIDRHFAHEERLMRAARYPSYRWHKRQHDNARKQTGRLIRRIKHNDPAAAPELIEYLSSWLDSHTRLADMMLGAFLRNRRRGLFKMTFRAGTKPADACEWRDSKGQKFDPGAPRRGY